MEKLKKILNREVIFYTIFGVLTTVVNITVSYILKAFFHVETNIASTIGIIACIIFPHILASNVEIVISSISIINILLGFIDIEFALARKDKRSLHDLLSKTNKDVTIITNKYDNED